MEPSADIAQRTIASVGWQTVGNMGRIGVSFIRITLLARWLPVEVFGIYGLAQSWAVLTGQVANFGMGGGFLHRAPETEDEQQAAAVHFTLKLVFTLGWASLMVIGAFLFTEHALRTAFLVLTATETGVHLTQTPQLILYRRIVHRRLALLDLVGSGMMTITSLALALLGARLWALLVMNITLMLVRLGLLYAHRPVWRPRLAWNRSVVRYYLRFGQRNFLAHMLAGAVDRVDDLWTGIWLGEVSLGLYSRAYEFATYPRKVLSRSVSVVSTGTYAELEADRAGLSKAFFRINAILVRTGFFLGGLMVLVAPEFIRLVLGEKWLPMLTPFRLMLVYTLLDPIKDTLANLFTAVGEPERVAKARGLQLGVLIGGLFTLGPWLGISGVALAVDIMLVAGIGLLLRWARDHVDFSSQQLFLRPVVALIVAAVLSFAGSNVLIGESSDWVTALVKVVVFSTAYGVVLIMSEFRQIVEIGSSAPAFIKEWRWGP